MMNHGVMTHMPTKKKTKMSAPKRSAKKTKKSASELSLMNLKVSDKDRKKLAANAKKFCKGNVSEWLRYAGMNYAPKASRIH